MATIFDLLSDLRSLSLDERDKGDKFERLVKAYLKTDPEWTARFDDVWTWSEWEGRGNVPDIGVDLVAKRRDADGFAAIQCKFYKAGHKVAKADIDSFLAATMRKDFSFTARYVFDTSAGWTNNVEKQVQGEVQRIDLAYLDDAAIDWDKFKWETPEVVVPTGPKTLRPHQNKALTAVAEGLATHDRGKLIMACGTGKTFTSLRIAEHLAGEGKSVLFLVPSIQLLSQSLREWMANTEVDIRPFAVCSDVRVGRKTIEDESEISTIDLTEPATTDPQLLVDRMGIGKYAKPRMTVVFSTYQSIDVIARAQELGLADFDLVICDEAHRTTGATIAGQDESAFVRIHDNTIVKAAKRLYMTATPRVFGDDVKSKAKDNDVVLADMGDEKTYGPELHRLGFGDAVEADLLTDYKVLVLAVDEQYVADNFQQAMSQGGEIALDDAARLIGCWNGLAKNFGDQAPKWATGEPEPTAVSLAPMRTAVAFAQNIKASKAATQAFPPLVDRALIDLPAGRAPLRVESQHVDGTMGISERNKHLAWLKEPTDGGVCRILTNARCLSEGVDVPALDAVLFLTPRSSQVDVVQSVGRVMRKAPGKELGYIILPVVVPTGTTPEEALAKNERFKVVWQVLQALRAHDDRFNAMVNQIDLNKSKPTEKIAIFSINGDGAGDQDGSSSTKPGDGSVQDVLEFPTDQFRDAMYAKIVQKVGERRYWESWAKDVAEIAERHKVRINGALNDEDSAPAKEFEVFLAGLRANLNESITRAEAIDMLAQHLVTRPIFEALFSTDTSAYDFTKTNPVAQIMELMLQSIPDESVAAENAALDKFYESVRRRVQGVDNAEGKQRILVELYDKFFAVAFKKTVDKLGIVYTPIEIVDFIVRSADAVLRKEFGQSISDEGVTVLDPFTGTGTFMVRLLQSGLIKPHDMARKYASELYANEILLLAYYIASVNIEQTYAEQIALVDPTAEARPFDGLILTDTFQSWEPHDTIDNELFVDNNARLERLKNLDITVIVGNPPYSVGQDSADDHNQNEQYPALDEEIRATYAERSTASLRRNLYDSYVRAIKWATLRIKNRGVVAFVTNGGFVDSNSFDGMRQVLADEFSAIHLYNLRGNQRTAGEQSRKEGGKVFGAGSRATVAIAVFVKNPDVTGPATIHYTDVGDYLTREEKLEQVSLWGDIMSLPAMVLSPNDHGDWISQRDSRFEEFMSLRGAPLIFAETSLGVSTSRDAWMLSSSKSQGLSATKRLIQVFNAGLDSDRVPEDFSTSEISWSRSLRSRYSAGRRIEARGLTVSQSTYRPFCKQWLSTEPALLEAKGQTLEMFAQPGQKAMTVLRPNDRTPFAILMIDCPPNLGYFMDPGQVFPLYRSVDAEGVLFGEEDLEVNITDWSVRRIAAAYPHAEITKDDIFFYVYGLLHSPEYRETYAADLKKTLPRIPIVRDFTGFAEAGRKLSELHLGYESVAPYPLNGLDVTATGDEYAYYAVGDKKMKFGKPTTEQKAAGEKADRSVIHYNSKITLTGIPEEAYRYMLGSRSAIEWIIDRYYIKTDKKSGIVNDPNDWSREVGNPRYILDLLARIVTVSLETMKIVDNLPALDIIDGA